MAVEEPPLTDNTGSVDTAAVPAVRLVDLYRTYGDVAAVKGISVDIGDGEFFSLIGPSGCGKTTTLRMVAGLVDPSGGRIEVHGRDVTHVKPHRRPVNTVFQQYALFPHLTVFENVAFGLRERRVSGGEIRERVSAMLDLVGLEGRDGHKPSMLSGGQQQRVALARSLVLRPEVLLLDEPLGALDLKLRKQLQMQLKRIQHEVGITFIYVTHDQEEAFSMSDRVAIMHDGVIEQLGSPREVYEHPSTEFVADFVGSSNRLYGTVGAVVGDGLYEIDLDGVGVVTSRGVPEIAAGQRGCVIVRPEAIAPRSAVDGRFGLSGTTLDVSYLGHHVTCVVQTGGDAQLTMSLREDARMVSPGRSCELSWGADAMWLVATDRAA